MAARQGRSGPDPAVSGRPARGRSGGELGARWAAAVRGPGRSAPGRGLRVPAGSADANFPGGCGDARRRPFCCLTPAGRLGF